MTDPSEPPNPAALHREFAAALAQEILLAERRGGARIKRVALAGRINVSRGSIYAYLNGNTLPTSDVFDRLLDALAITGPVARRLRTLRDDVEIRRLGRCAVTSPPGGGSSKPRQLPAAARHFVGRGQELRELDRVLDGSDDTTTDLVAIVGTAGVGKTTLALHWAHRVKNHYRDGQLYADLRGFDPRTPAPAGRILHRFLETFGVGAAAIPTDLDAKAALYRSILAEQRVLVVLDNVRSAEHARHLIPGSTGCLTVVTSRQRLDGLVVHEGARRIRLEVLPPAEAQSLVAGVVGAERVAAEPAAAGELAKLAAYLPLALTVAAAHAAGRPGAALSVIAAELREADRLPAVLTSDDDSGLNLRALFHCSYTALPASAARLFRLLGTHRCPEVTIWTCAALLDASALPTTELELLAAAHLVRESKPGRFGLHDLLRSYARELADAMPEAERRAALGRLLDHYAATAALAGEQIQPCHEFPIPLGRRPPSPQPIDDHAAAMTWFASEWPVLRTMVATAIRHRFTAQACTIAWASTVYLRRTGRHTDRADVHRLALSVARDADNRVAHAITMRLLADASAQLEHRGDAASLLRTSLAEFHALGHDDGVHQTHLSLTRVHLARGNDREALEHAENALRPAGRGGIVALTGYGDPGRAEGEAHVLRRLSDAELRLDAYESALARYERAVEPDRRLDDR